MRVSEFDDLFRAALRSLERSELTRLALTLASAPDRVETVRDLTRRETECCSFFTFRLTEQPDLLLPQITVPPAHVDTLDAVAERAARVSGLAT